MTPGEAAQRKLLAAVHHLEGILTDQGHKPHLSFGKPGGGCWIYDHTPEHRETKRVSVIVQRTCTWAGNSRIVLYRTGEMDFVGDTLTKLGGWDDPAAIKRALALVQAEHDRHHLACGGVRKENR